MKTLLLALGGFAAACSPQTPAPAPPPTPVATAAAGPRLLVLVSVDQLASWVFDEAAPFLAADGGFHRLLQRGTRFPDCAYQHACTETGPGHATIGTGLPATRHGIVRNSWWFPDEGKVHYCVEQPMAPVDGLPEGKDRGPGRLLVPTFASRLRQAVPGSRIASVAWKDRSAILMVGKDADCVAWMEYTTGNLVTNQAWSTTAPEWIQAWNRERPHDRFFGWTWDRLGPEAAYAGLVDDRPYEAPHGNGSKLRTLPQPLTGGATAPNAAFYAQMYGSPVGNEVVRLAAERCQTALGLGSDEVVDLLCVSFSSTDVIGHTFGADSVEARDGMLRLDRTLGALLDHLDATVGQEHYALFLTADHGVVRTPEWEQQKGVDAGRGVLQTRARAAAEQALREALGPAPTGRRYIAHVGEFSFYLDAPSLAAARGERSETAIYELACSVAAKAAAGAGGIYGAWPTAVVRSGGAGDDAVLVALRHALCDGRAGDVQLVLKPGWLDGTTTASHGTPHAYDRRVVGIAVGPGVPAGKVDTTPITPGFGAVWFAALSGTAPIDGAPDVVPAEWRR